MDGNRPGFNNAEWMSIVNFYLHTDLCQHLQGVVKNFKTGTALMHHLKPKDSGLGFRPIYSDTSLNVIVPLKSEFNGAEINFFHQNCTLNNFIPGRLYVFPGEITHAFEILPIKSGTFSFAEIKVGTQSLTCYESYGLFHCPGFKVDEDNPPQLVQNHPRGSKNDQTNA